MKYINTHQAGLQQRLIEQDAQLCVAKTSVLEVEVERDRLTQQLTDLTQQLAHRDTLLQDVKVLTLICCFVPSLIFSFHLICSHLI